MAQPPPLLPPRRAPVEAAAAPCWVHGVRCCSSGLRCECCPELVASPGGSAAVSAWAAAAPAACWEKAPWGGGSGGFASRGRGRGARRARPGGVRLRTRLPGGNRPAAAPPDPWGSALALLLFTAEPLPRSGQCPRGSAPQPGLPLRYAGRDTSRPRRLRFGGGSVRGGIYASVQQRGVPQPGLPGKEAPWRESNQPAPVRRGPAVRPR